MHNSLKFAVLALATTGCATNPPPPPIAVVGAGDCRNNGFERFVGQRATAELGAQLQQASGARSIQWIQPGQMVTMEFRSDRLRVRLGAGNLVVGANCG